MKRTIEALAILGLAAVAYKFRSQIMNGAQALPALKDTVQNKQFKNKQNPVPTFMDKRGVPANQSTPVTPQPWFKKSA